MRPFETALLVALALALLRFTVPSVAHAFRRPWFEGLAVLLLISHLILEGYRWQMIPAYGLLLLFSSYVLWRGPARERSPQRSSIWGMAALGWLLFLPATALPILLPVPQLAPPAGPYGVGTTTWHLVDAARVDPYAPDPNTQRELMVQVWYPIEAGTLGEAAPWMDSAERIAPAIADWLELPPFFLDHIKLVTTNAIEDAPPALTLEPAPLLLFSHGWGGFRAQNTNQMHHLASHGYYVAAIEHTYSAVLTVFPDGTEARHNPATLVIGGEDEQALRAARALGAQWSQDLSFVLDHFQALMASTEPTPHAGRIDLSRVAAFGHSTGGGAAIEFCAVDPRCAAVLTMDPFLQPVSERTLAQGLGVPAAHLFSETWSSPENTQRFDRLLEVGSAEVFVARIQGTAHYDFSDLPLLTPLAHIIGLKGPLAGARVAEIVNTYALAFFDRSLRGMPSELFSGPSLDFPEVVFGR